MGNRARSAPGGEAHGLVGIGIEDKEGLRDFGGLGLIIFAMSAHLTLAVAAHTMGSDGQEGPAKMPCSTSQQPQGAWELLRLFDRVSSQELMHGPIADDKRQAMEQCNAFVAQGALRASPAHAQRGLVDQLQRHAWRSTRGRVASPPA